MKIEDAFNSIKIKDFNDLLKTALLNEKVKLSSEDRKFLIKKICRFKDIEINDTLKAIAIMSIWEPKEAITEARKKGVFRYRAYGFHENKALYLINNLLQFKDLLCLTLEDQDYLIMKQGISWLFDYYRNTEKFIIKYIKKREVKHKVIKRGKKIINEALFKELLVYIDCYFHITPPSYIENKNKNSLKNYCKENITEAVSYIIFLYDKVIGIKNNRHYFADPNIVLSDELEKIILLACKLNQVEEWELYIDYFKYVIERNGDTYTISSSKRTLEETIRLGYIRRDMQERFFIKEKEKKFMDCMPMSELMDYVNAKIGETLLLEIEDGELSRYRINVPIPLLKKISQAEFFKEELISSMHLADELIISHKELQERKVTTASTIEDVMYFQRAFVILQFLTSELLYKKDNKNKVLSSLVPHMNEFNMKEILNIFLKDQTKVEELLEIFTYKPNSRKLDLQYTPFITSSHGFYFSNTITSMSRLARNIIAYSYMINNQVVNDDQGRETLVKFCEEIFLDAGYSVVSNQKYTYMKVKGEVDIIVSNETDILLIECKCPLAPTSVFELRSSYEHVEKANKQLDRILSALEDKNFRKNKFKQWNITDNNQNLRTCIVFGNRLFNGYKESQHPIRYIYELNKILSNGVITSGDCRWRIWEKDIFQHTDLLNFITEGSFINMAIQALEKTNLELHLEDKKITFETYALNTKELIELYDQNLYIVETLDVSEN